MPFISYNYSKLSVGLRTGVERLTFIMTGLLLPILSAKIVARFSDYFCTADNDTWDGFWSQD